ncbi:MAG: HDIG domain-containing protein [Chthonomonas sp.]|nr:HDIG domain-containing protein [Chthonomonas sp.]
MGPFQKLAELFAKLRRNPVARRTLHSVTLIVWSASVAGLMIAHRSPGFLGHAFLANFGMALAAAILTVFHIRHTPSRTVSWDQSQGIIFLASLLTMLGVHVLLLTVGNREIVGAGFLLTTPLVAQAMLTSAVIGPAVALYALTVTGFLLGFSGALSIEMLATGWIAGAVGVHAVNPLKQRSDLLRAASIMVVSMALTAAITSAGMVATIAPVLESMGWAAIAAVAATSIFWLMVAVFERLFGLVSDWSLLELCSPDHPLLRDLCLRAPGTYAHSVMVGNLAETAAREIGANAVLARAMAYFHDVGKSRAPSFFIENQIGENLHDSMPAALSAQVIASHVRDGVEMARAVRLPRSIIDGISQHHGTSLISYFFNRAVQGMGREAMDPEFEKLFRYPGPKPQSREAAILHLADQVEAASRSIPSRNPEEMEIAIARIVENSRAEGQLDECDLTFADLQTVQRSFARSLGAIRHERVHYPEIDRNEEFKEPISRHHRERNRPESAGHADTHRADSPDGGI